MTDRHWFEPLADHLGEAYLRYSFTKGTTQEVGFLARVLQLRPGASVLDVGCGPGRHALALAELGAKVVGVDRSMPFVRLAADGARQRSGGGDRAGGGSAAFVRGDARLLPVRPVFDVVLSLCQGGFGLLGGAGDVAAFESLAAAVRPGGRLCLSAFSAYFQVRYLEPTDDFDAATGVNHEHTTVRNPDGVEVPAELWTTCFTPRELELLAERCGLTVEGLWSVTPGDYAERPPDVEHPELLLVARRP